MPRKADQNLVLFKDSPEIYNAICGPLAIVHSMMWLQGNNISQGFLGETVLRYLHYSRFKDGMTRFFVPSSDPNITATIAYLTPQQAELEFQNHGILHDSLFDRFTDIQSEIITPHSPYFGSRFGWSWSNGLDFRSIKPFIYDLRLKFSSPDFDPFAVRSAKSFENLAMSIQPDTNCIIASVKYTAANGTVTPHVVTVVDFDIDTNELTVIDSAKPQGQCIYTIPLNEFFQTLYTDNTRGVRYTTIQKK